MEYEQYPLDTQQETICIPQEVTISDIRLAQAYVPIQKLCTTFAPKRALAEGTAFPELSEAYEPTQWQREGVTV